MSDLKTTWGMTEKEASDHVYYTLDSNECITSTFKKKLSLKAEYVVNQGVAVDFFNYPSLSDPIDYGRSGVESTADHTNRVKESLKNVITFYNKSGENITPSMDKVTVNLRSYTMTYPVIEYSYITVDPTYVEDCVLKSNLYDSDYSRIVKKISISAEICQQVDTVATFSVLPKDATYLKPKMTVSSMGISKRIEGTDNFKSIYIADALDTFIPFEYFYSDTSSNPQPYYYTAYLNISNIYMDDIADSTVKNFNVKDFNMINELLSPINDK
jgi:hypothetical protein